jgi:hypothetical protein
MRPCSDEEFPGYTTFFISVRRHANIYGGRGSYAEGSCRDRGFLQAGISNSITQIKNFATAKGGTLSAANTPSTTAYKTAVDGLYAAASNKLDVIGMEFYKAVWGNGLEAYNLYRRTSAPRNMQATLQVNPGVWLRTQVYPSAYVNLNQNAKQKDAQSVVKTFWDNNPETLN